MYYCLPKSSFLPPNLFLAEFISWYGKDKHEVLHLKTHREKFHFHTKYNPLVKCFILNTCAQWPMGMRIGQPSPEETKNWDLWKAPRAISGPGVGVGNGSRGLDDEVLGFTLGSRPLGQELGQAVLDCVVEKWQLRGSQGDGWRSEAGEVSGEDFYILEINR